MPQAGVSYRLESTGLTFSRLAISAMASSSKRWRSPRLLPNPIRHLRVIRQNWLKIPRFRDRIAYFCSTKP
jgi:hypothetical protein